MLIAILRRAIRDIFTPVGPSREREREIPYSKGTLRASGPPYTKKGGMAANYEVGVGEGRLSNILDEVTAAPQCYLITVALGFPLRRGG